MACASALAAPTDAPADATSVTTTDKLTTPQYRGVRHLVAIHIGADEHNNPSLHMRALRWWADIGRTLKCWEGARYVVIATQLTPSIDAHLDERSRHLAHAPNTIIAAAVFDAQKMRKYMPECTPLHPPPTFALICRLQRAPASFSASISALPLAQQSHPDILCASFTKPSASAIPTFHQKQELQREEERLLAKLEVVRRARRQLEDAKCDSDAEPSWHQAIDIPLRRTVMLKRDVRVYETTTPLQALQTSTHSAPTLPPGLHIRRNPAWVEICALMMRNLRRSEPWDLVSDDDETLNEWRLWASYCDFIRVHAWVGGRSEGWPGASLRAPTLVVSLTGSSRAGFLGTMDCAKTIVWLERCDTCQEVTDLVQQYWALRTMQEAHVESTRRSKSARSDEESAAALNPLPDADDFFPEMDRLFA